MKFLVPAFAALTLSAAGASAMAATAGSMYGEPADGAYAERTVVVTPQTKYINVAHGEVVKVKVGSEEFAWNFDGLPQSFELNRIVPEGALDHPVKVYVSTGADGGFGD